MRLIKPSFKIMEQAPGIEGAYEQVARAAMNCYQTTKRKDGETAQDYCNRVLIHSEKWIQNHGAMFEHGTVYLALEDSIDEDGNITPAPKCKGKYSSNAYSKVIHHHYITKIADKSIKRSSTYITTNLRVILENDWEDDLQFWCEPTEFHLRRRTVYLETSIHVYKDLTRHRIASFAIESTRFCNYLKEKFGSSLTFTLPPWLRERDVEEFKRDLAYIESIYFKWINKGWQAQQAAYFLIQGTKGSVIITTWDSDWKHIFALRADGVSGPPLPSVTEIMVPLKQEFIKRGYLKQ